MKKEQLHDTQEYLGTTCAHCGSDLETCNVSASRSGTTYCFCDGYCFVQWTPPVEWT